MKNKYILQLKRRYYWEDVLTFYNKKDADIYYIRLLQQGIQSRVVEVCYLGFKN